MSQTAFLAGSFLGLLLLFSCRKPQEELPYYNTPDFNPYFLSEKEAAKTITHQIGKFSFKDETNKDFTNDKLKNKIHLASFIFTSCGNICPKIVENLSVVNEKFKNNKEVEILSFTVTPWIDTPQKLKKFKEDHKITAQNWHFLTGDKAKIYSIARKSYFAEEDIGFSKDSTQFLHTEHIILVDKNKKIRGIYNGTMQTDMQQLIADIESLKK